VILIALGANLPSEAGSPEQTLRASLVALSEKDVIIKAVSRAFKSQAWPNPTDPPFINAVATIEVAPGPVALMDKLENIERAFGRERGARNAPRTLDLDLIDYDGRVENGPPILPHPRAHERAFVLVPIMDIAPDWRHPVSRRSVQDMLDTLRASALADVTPIGPLWP